MKQLLTTTALVLAMPAYYYSQNHGEVASQTITAQPDKYGEQIDFVYGQAFFEQNQTLKDQFVRLLRDRVELVHQPQPADEKFPKISMCPLMSKHNAAIVAHDPTTFSADTFNPLIYGWDFFSDKVQVFRIDGTEYLLIVQPQ